MKIAILGLAQTGKKTLFTLLTGRTVPAARKAGEAIEGVAAIRDGRVDALSELFQPKKTVYAENQNITLLFWCRKKKGCGNNRKDREHQTQ